MSKTDNPRDMLPQVSDLQALRAMASDGTVSQAARRLGITQSGLSYALERMRRRFGDPLFVRVGNRMAPTPKRTAHEYGYGLPACGGDSFYRLVVGFDSHTPGGSY